MLSLLGSGEYAVHRTWRPGTVIAGDSDSHVHKRRALSIDVVPAKLDSVQRVEIRFSLRAYLPPSPGIPILDLVAMSSRATAG